MERTHDSLRYVRGVTSVHTSAHEAFVDGAGVCQDFAHLALAMTKSVGLPSRYVSGYFHPEADAVIGEEIVGESHAWVEVWTGLVVGLRPHQRLPRRRAARGHRAGTGLLRRAPGQGDLRRQRRAHHEGRGAHHEDPLSVLARMRIWLPDAPGVLGAVAAEIGAVDGNVVGLEVLEREAGVAIDEFVVELPDVAGAVDAVCKGIRNIPGAGVEEVRESCAGAVQDREDTVLNAAAAILQAATPTAAMNALSGQLMSLFDLTWLAVADLGTESFVEVHGEVPTIAWVAAFATGSQSGSDPSNDTTSSGVFVEEIPETALTVCGGETGAHPPARTARHLHAGGRHGPLRRRPGWREHAH